MELSERNEFLQFTNLSKAVCAPHMMLFSYLGAVSEHGKLAMILLRSKVVEDESDLKIIELGVSSRVAASQDLPEVCVSKIIYWLLIQKYLIF